MKKIFILLILCVTAVQAFTQTDALRIAPGAEGHFTELLNKPAMVSPVSAVALGKNWFSLVTDAHVFTDQVTVGQVAAVLLDLDNQIKYFDGKRSKLHGKIISRGAGFPEEYVVDFISVAIVPVVNIRLNTPYRSTVKVIYNSSERFAKNIIQQPQDSETNKDIKKLNGVRYAQEVTIGGKKYTYIRMYTINEVNASILPGAKNALDRNAGPTVLEALEALIIAAKTK